LLENKTFFLPQATPNKSEYFFKAEANKIPGLSLLLKTSGLSRAPVDVITFFALIFNNLCLILFLRSWIGRWSVRFSLANK
jgi:hypothetical protein